MREEEVETAIKVVVVGNGAVGKSSMIQRYCRGVFTKEYKKTIGLDFLERQIEVNGEDIRLMLWDTAGQEEFDAITKAYYRGAQACVLVYSTTDRASFDSIETWKEKVEQEVGGEMSMVIVQNKIDLIDQAAISVDESEGLARKLNLRFYRTSAKDNLNIEAVFRYLSSRYVDHLCKLKVTQPTLKKIGPFVNSDELTDQLISTKHKTNTAQREGRNGDATIKLQSYKVKSQWKSSFLAKCTIL